MNGKLPLVLFLLTLMVFTGQAVTKLDREYFLAADPYWIMLVSRSLATDGDIDLKDEHEFKPENVADQVALGKNGEWYPLHEWLLGAIGAPFYKAFGERGCLLLNLLIASSFSVVLYLLAAQFAPPLPAFLAAALTIFPSALSVYAYSFSIDLFGAFLFTLAALALVLRRPALAGAIFGLSVLGRNANLFTLPAFALFFLVDNRKLALQNLIRFACGGLPFGIAFFAQNVIQYGSPLTFSYLRWIPYRDGALVITPQTDSFGSIHLRNVVKMLLAPETGLLPGSPLVLLALLCGGRGVFQKHPSFAIFGAVASLSLLLVFSSYSIPYPALGNRYLLAVIAVSVVPLALFFAELFSEPSHSPLRQRKHQP